MRVLFFSACVLAGMVLFSSSKLPAQKIKVDYDKSADFSRYKTYAWVKGTPASNPNWDFYILSVADGMMEKKGLKKVDPQNADVLVTYHAAVNSSLNLTGFADPTFAAVGGIPVQGQTVWSDTSTGTSGQLVQKGQLAFQMLDRANHKIVWTGTSSGSLKDTQTEKVQQVGKAINKVFDRYPPSGK